MGGNYAFIGLGAMGYAMASNVRKNIPSSETFYINDVYRPACVRFREQYSSFGPIEIVDNAKEAAAKARVVISIVPGASDVRKVYLDEETGVIAAPANPSRLLLECSTIDSATTRDVGEKLIANKSGTYIDTPVSGGVPAAEAGTLAFLVGHSKPADDDPVSRDLESVITTMGEPKKFFYCGKLGAGLAAKISNNYLAGTILLATAEAVAIGIKSGIDKHLLYQVIKHSSGQSWMCDHVHPVAGVIPTVPSSNNYKPGFKTHMMIKDMSLGIEAGKLTGIQPTMAEAAIKVYETASEDPQCIDRDGSSVYLHIGGPLE